MTLKFALVLALLASPALAGDYDDLPKDLAAAAYAFDAAQLHGGGAALRQLLADDYKLANSSGQVEDKKQFIADYTDPNFKVLPFALRKPIHIVWPDGALLGAAVSFRFIDHEKPGRVDFRFGDVWAKRGGRWQVVYTQTTKLPPAK